MKFHWIGSYIMLSVLLIAGALMLGNKEASFMVVVAIGVSIGAGLIIGYSTKK